MPTETAHLKLAFHNQNLIDRLKEQKEFPDWLATAAFYKALHLVEAVFFNNKEIRHGTSHDNRAHHLKTNNKYSNIYKNFRPLWS